MLEGFAAWLLRTYVGEYVENLNTDQLTIGYGGIELYNLHLRKSALQGLDLPVVVKSGIIGHLKLEIPFRNPKSLPWIILINKLYIVAGNQIHSEFDESEYNAHIEIEKQKKLGALEKSWQSRRQSRSKGWLPSIYSSFSSTVLENLQLIINDVHIKYEESQEKDETFSFGMTIKRLAAQSTNASWLPQFLHTDDLLKYKLVELKDLCIYWNPYDDQLGNIDPEDLEAALLSPNENKKLQCILDPVSGYAKVTRNSSLAPLKSKDGPRFVFDLSLDTIPMRLSNQQYIGMLRFFGNFQRYFQAQRYCRWRPCVPIKNHCDLWWRFAIDCHLSVVREKRRRWSRAFILERVRDITIYTDAYFQHLTNPSISPEKEKIRQMIETKMTLAELCCLRNLVTSRITREEEQKQLPKSENYINAKQQSVASSYWGSWIHGWTGWSNEVTPLTDDKVTTQEEEELLDELIEGQQDESIFNRDFVFAQVHFNLDGCTFTLNGSSPDSKTSIKPLVQFEFANVSWFSEMRPRHKAWEFKVELGAVYMRDLLDQASLLPVLIEPQDSDNQNDSKSPLLQINFEQIKVGGKSEKSLQVTMQPLKLIYKKDMMKQLSHFFKESMESKYELKISEIEHQLQSLAFHRYEELKQLTKTEFAHAINSLMQGDSLSQAGSPSWCIQLEISAPLIVIPERFKTSNSPVVIFNLGHLSFANSSMLHKQKRMSETVMTSLDATGGPGTNESDSDEDEEFETPCSTPPNLESINNLLEESAFESEQELNNTVRHKFYENYTLNLSDLQILVCQMNDPWQNIAQARGSTPHHVLDQLTIALQIERRLVFTADSNWPNLTVSAKLPVLTVHIDENKLNAMSKLRQICEVDEDERDKADFPGGVGNSNDEDVKASPSVDQMAADGHLQLRAKELMVESRIILSQLAFHRVSLNLHSRGRCIAELRFDGVEIEYTKRPFDFSTVFVLQSVRLIDAIQTYGAEFELLVCSHHENSRIFPCSTYGCTDGVKLQDEPLSDALIRIDYQNISPSCPSLVPGRDDDQPLQIVNLQFNCLALTANQETVVELINVINYVLPKDDSRPSASFKWRQSGSQTPPSASKASQSKNMHMDATFNSITVTLVRGELAGERKVGRKVAKLTVTDIEMTAILQDQKSIRGSLGGLEVTSLIPESTVHSCMMAIGSCDNEQDNVTKALLFTFEEGLASSQLHQPNDTDKRIVSADVKLASAYYLHDPFFLSELQLCASDFHNHMRSFKNSVQSAAADIAKSFISRHHLDTTSDNTSSGLRMASIVSLDDETFCAEGDIDDLNCGDESRRVYICIELDSPVMVIPEGRNEHRLLVGYLGQMSMHNTYVSGNASMGVSPSSPKLSPMEQCNDRIYFNMQAMRLNAIEVVPPVDAHNHEKRNVFDLIASYRSDADVLKVINILHDMSIKITIDRLCEEQEQPMFKIVCGIPSDMRLRLSTSTYRQLLLTLENLSVNQSDVRSPPMSPIATIPSMPGTATDVNHVSTESGNAIDLTDQTNDRVIMVTAELNVPQIQVELAGELQSNECDFATVKLQDFTMSYSNLSHPESNAIVTLGYLSVEDLLHNGDVRHSYLLRSSNPNDTQSSRRKAISNVRLSSSCPEPTPFDITANLSASLPSVFHSSPVKVPKLTVFRPMLLEKERRNDGDEDNNIFTESDANKNLVTIKVKMIDDQYISLTEHNNIGRYINIEFNGLDLTLNLQTWVVLLEFFGIGVPMPSPTSDSSCIQPNATGTNQSGITSTVHPLPETVKPFSKISVEMHCLTVTLNKKDYPLAKAKVERLGFAIVLEGPNQTVSGSIGKLELLDVSPHSAIYSKRFLTAGKEALSFEFTRYGPLDPDLKRSFDMSLTLVMSSVFYVHTQRFTSEVISFCQHFVQLQEVLGRMRAAKQGNEVFLPVNRAARLLLDIKADTPVLILPQSSKSRNALVGHLGSFTVKNCFIWSDNDLAISSKVQVNRFRKSTAGGESADTIQTQPSEHSEENINTSSVRLLDHMEIKLKDMEIFSASYKGSPFSDELPSLERLGGRLMKNSCRLELIVERNLEWAFGRDVPDNTVSGSLSSLDVNLDLSQFGLIMNMLGDNLGEPLEQFERPSDLLVDPAQQLQQSDDLWTGLSITFELVNVSVQMIPGFTFGPLASKSDNTREPHLGQLEFVESKFIYASYSDGSKAFDLVSNVVLLHDSRGSDAADSPQMNRFKRIVEPTAKTKSSSFQTGSPGLQFEVHYLDLLERNTLTFLFSHSKIVLIFDFIKAVYHFITRRRENDYKDSKKGSTLESKSSTSSASASNDLSSPTGVITKTIPPNDKVKVKKTFELKLNIADTELVLVEDASCLDTQAIILQTTAVVAWRPNHPSERPLTCSLQSLELFSCILSDVDGSALSIVDPVTLLIELNPDPKPNMQASAGLLHAVTTLPTLEVNCHSTLSVRLSYNDVMMFLRIIKSVNQQLSVAAAAVLPPSMLSTNGDSIIPFFTPEAVEHLVKHGFTKNDCEEALTETHGNLDVSLYLLTKRFQLKEAREKQGGQRHLAGFHVRAHAICICVIDDCGDNDIPLFELILSGINLSHQFQYAPCGSAYAFVLAEYYNRSVSGWEPFVEKWKCHGHWQQRPWSANSPIKTIISVDAPEQLDINITKALISMIQVTLPNWSKHYFSSESLKSTTKKRAPFVPFVLRNKSGCCLRFATLTTSPMKDSNRSHAQTNADIEHHDTFRSVPPPTRTNTWYSAGIGHEVAFSFETRDKMRHKATHELKVHQLVVQIDGWHPTTPVSVDQIGVFFRHISLATGSTPGSNHRATMSARVVLDVTLEGARKVVTIRSSLLLINKLEIPVQCQLLAPTTNQVHILDNCLLPNSTLPIPLNLVMWDIFVRPTNHEYKYCNAALKWKDVTTRFTEQALPRQCKGDTDTYRFNCVVRRDGYPDIRSSMLHDAKQGGYFMAPGHSLFLTYQLVLFNLLPVDLFYLLDGTKRIIEPGKFDALHNADLSTPLDLGLSFENYPHFQNVKIFSKYRNDPVIIPVQCRDVNRRPLLVYVKVEQDSGTIKLSIYAPYWLVNRTGLPLIFRREGEVDEVAGQLEEHERAQSRSPLLFSFIDKEASFRCQMRIGKEIDGLKNVSSLWSNPPFSLDIDTSCLTLYIKRGRSQPEGAYEIGVEVTNGNGLFKCTRVVSFVTRYQLENRTLHSLAYAQRHIVKSQMCRNPEGSLAGPRSAVTLFHWSRSDLDQLLCVRFSDVDHCKWSGGFRIDTEDSFHINMRSTFSNVCLFVRVEILFEGATYFVIFTDAAQLPPPFRIDNMAEVEIVFSQQLQQQSPDTTKDILVKPNQSFPYALDEPSLAAVLHVSVFGETSCDYDLLKTHHSLASLFYQNCIYIQFTHTFSTSDFNICCHGESSDDPVPKCQLVFDVLDDKYVVLSKKVPPKRSQFWRMTSVGELEHVGSSSPQDPRQLSPAIHKRSYVLDVDVIKTERGKRVGRLILKRPDPQRFATQTWSFEDGYLKCSLSNLVVQPEGGLSNLKEGCHAVVGEMKKSPHVPHDQCLTRQKLRPGSGVLNVSVLADGPTRVLRVSDMQKQYVDESDWMAVTKKQDLRLCPLDETQSEESAGVEVNINFAEGIGLSLINSIPEEIIFATLSQIKIELHDSCQRQSINASIGLLQVDNQVFGSTLPVAVYQTPATIVQNRMHHTDAFQLAIQREKSSDFNILILRRCLVSVSKLNIQLDEPILLKLLQFFDFGPTEAVLTDDQPTSLYESQRVGLRTPASSDRRFYFEDLRIDATQLRISFSAGSGRLTPDLVKIKHVLSIPIVSLEDAVIVLGALERRHLFERRSNVTQQLVRHYKNAIISQAASVLGSLDILGNPMGLLHDVSAGVEGLVKKGNLGGLFVNVAHGLSDTAAKMTGTIADGLWSASMDNKFQESRDAMRVDKASSSGDHLVAGFKGLGMGLFGGLTSIITQPVDGAARKGLPGFISGIGKGLVGTVAKPAAGVLDLASGAAAAVRGSARARTFVPQAIRLKRNCYASGGLLPPYSKSNAEGQDILGRFNEGNSDERFVLSESIRKGNDDNLRAIITTAGIYFVNSKLTPCPENIILHVDYMKLYEAGYISKDSKHYLELVMCKESCHGNLIPSREPGDRPRVRCDSSAVAHKICLEINYMKNLFEEKQLQVQREEGGR